MCCEGYPDSCNTIWAQSRTGSVKAKKITHYTNAVIEYQILQLMLSHEPSTLQIQRTEHTGSFTKEHINHKLDSWHACWLQLVVQKNMLAVSFRWYAKRLVLLFKEKWVDAQSQEQFLKVELQLKFNELTQAKGKHLRSGPLCYMAGCSFLQVGYKLLHMSVKM